MVLKHFYLKSNRPAAEVKSIFVGNSNDPHATPR